MTTTAGSSIDFEMSGVNAGGSLGRRTPSPFAARYLHENLSRLSSPLPKQQSFTGVESDLSELRQQINRLEEQKLELTTKHNEQISELDGESAKWRALAERGEATRQSLEYELAVLKKALNKEKQSGAEREQKLNLIVQQNRERNVDLTARVQELEAERNSKDSEASATVNTLKKSLTEKEYELESIRAEKDKILKDKHQIEQVFHEQENLYADTQEKLSSLKRERDAQTETIRRQLKDLQYAAERADRNQKEMEIALAKIKSLEENIETERASHLESKFNSELVQLRVRDLQGSLDVEKAAHNEVRVNAEVMSKQLRELEAAYDDMKVNNEDLREQLERSKGDYSSVRCRLSAELEGKHSMVSDMSEQLQIHQKSFTELKDELTKAKRRQIYLEETYGGCMQELELLIQGAKHMHVASKKRSKKSEPMSPMEVLGTLRTMLTEYQKKFNGATKEMAHLKTSCDKIGKECKQYKEIIWEKDTALKDVQRKYSTSSKDLERAQSQLTECQTQLSALKMALQRVEQDHIGEKNRGQDLAEEFIRQLKSLEDVAENQRQYLHGIYQRIKSGPAIPGLIEESPVSVYSWDRLSQAVQGQISALVSAYNQANQKVTHLETALRNKDELLKQSQESHEDSLSKLMEAGKQREQDWTMQREKLEKQFEKQLADLKRKSTKTELAANKALENAKSVNNIKEELLTNTQHLQEELSRCQQDRTHLLAASALLLGALLPLIQRTNVLVTQRNMLMEQIRRYDSVQEQLIDLAGVMNSEMDTDSLHTGWRHKKGHLLLKFRRASLVILAANRLQRLGLQRMTQASIAHANQPCQSSQLPICFIDIPVHPDNTSLRLPKKKALSSPYITWIDVNQLLQIIHQSCIEISQCLMNTVSASPSSIHQSAEQSLHTLMSKVISCMPPDLAARCQPMRDDSSLISSRPGLVTHLAHGLKRALAYSFTEGHAENLTTLGAVSCLRSQILNFTKRLHSAEVERRSLRVEVSQLKDEIQVVGMTASRADTLEREVVELQHVNQTLVPKEKFDSVCRELNDALRREHEAQQILNEQGGQLDELSYKLNVQSTATMDKEYTINEATKELSDAKMDLKRKEQSLRQLSKQLVKLEEDKYSIQERMQGSEAALKLATKERDAVTSYIKSVQSTIDKIRRNTIGKVDTNSLQILLTQLTTSDLLQDGDHRTPQYSAIQGLLSSFMEAQRTATTKIGQLEEEIASHKQHISSLKKELSAVCRRERDDGNEVETYCGNPFQFEKRFSPSKSYTSPARRQLFMPQGSNADEFVQIRPEIDLSSASGTPLSKQGSNWSRP